MSNLQKKIIPINECNRIDGSRVGRIVRIDDDGTVWADYDSNPHGLIVARICDGVRQALASASGKNGADVLMIFENGQSDRPVVIDVIHDRYSEPPQAMPAVEAVPNPSCPKDAVIDGKTITFDATDQIVLKCGKSSIVLTQNGKVIIRGAYLLNRSTGVNHIKGGSVKIN